MSQNKNPNINKAGGAAEQGGKNNSKKWSIVKKVAVVLLSFGVLVGVALLDPDIAQAGDVLRSANPLFIALAVCSMLLSYLSNNTTFMLTCKMMGVPQTFKDSIINTMLGFFYCALTPFASGGQPLQIIEMRSRGIPAGTASSVTVIKFIAWQIPLMITTTLAMILEWGTVEMSTAEAGVLVFGYVSNLVLLLVATLSFVYPKFISSAGVAVVNFLGRIKLIHNEEKRHKLIVTWKRSIEDYRAGAWVMWKNGIRTVLVILSGFFEGAFYMFVTFCVFNAFGITQYSPVTVMLMQCMLYVGVSFIPLPGASIASEGGFYLIFGVMVSAGLRFPVMLVWRLITYHLSLFLGLAFVIADGVRKKPSKDSVKAMIQRTREKMGGAKSSQANIDNEEE